LDGLYRRHHGAVYRYCVGVLRSSEEAADAAQSVWVRVLVALSAPGVVVLCVRAWLFAIARNECLDRLRAGRLVELVDVGELEVAGGVGPEEVHEAREEVGALLGDLGALSERQRSAIVLRELCGLGAEELGEALGTTAGRALGLVADARRRLVVRRSGRLLACEQVRGELVRARRRPGGVCAHLEACRSCQAFERRRRGRALSSLGVAPWGLVPFVGGKLGALGVCPAAVKGVLAAGVVAAAVGVSSPVLWQAPFSGGASGAHHQPLARAGEGPARSGARGAGVARVRPAGSRSSTVATAPGDPRLAVRTRRAAPGALRAALPRGAGRRGTAEVSPAAPAPAPVQETPGLGGRSRPGPAEVTIALPAATPAVVGKVGDDALTTGGRVTGDTLAAGGRVGDGTLGVVEGATDAVGVLSR